MNVPVNSSHLVFVECPLQSLSEVKFRVLLKRIHFKRVSLSLVFMTHDIQYLIPRQKSTRVSASNWYSYFLLLVEDMRHDDMIHDHTSPVVQILLLSYHFLVVDIDFLFVFCSIDVMGPTAGVFRWRDLQIKSGLIQMNVPILR